MGGRGSSSGVGGATASANAMLPTYDTKALAERMSTGLPELSGTPKQVRWASDIRDEAQETMLAAITAKYNIGNDTYQDIANGKKSMKDGVQKHTTQALEFQEIKWLQKSGLREERRHTKMFRMIYKGQTPFCKAKQNLHGG